MAARHFSLALAFGLTVSSLSAGEAEVRKARGGSGAAVKMPAPKPPNLPKPQAPPANRPGQGQPAKSDTHPGEQLVDRLMKMTPQERENALKGLPPERRDNLNRRLDAISKMPTAQQTRIRNRQEMLNSLPPQRQALVRRSVQQFVNMPEERRAVVNQELSRIAPLPDEERRAYMNTEEFRNKYSAREQQMLSHLAEVTPQP